VFADKPVDPEHYQRDPDQLDGDQRHNRVKNFTQQYFHAASLLADFLSSDHREKDVYKKLQKITSSLPIILL
jgi:hypothetical protein